MQSAKCDLKDIKEAIVNINSTLLSYAKNKENYDEQQDSHWIATRQSEERIAKIEDTVYSNETGRPGLQGQMNIMSSKLERVEHTLMIISEKTKQDMIELLKPLNESMNKVEERNLKKDAIGNFKSEIPNKWLTYLQIAALIAPVIFYILSLNK